MIGLTAKFCTTTSATDSDRAPSASNRFIATREALRPPHGARSMEHAPLEDHHDYIDAMLSYIAKRGMVALREAWRTLPGADQAAAKERLETVYKPLALAAAATGRVELLRDCDGVYGVGFVGTFVSHKLEPPRIITRLDKLKDPPCGSSSCAPFLQGIPKFFKNSMEHELVDALLTAMLARAGIDRDNPGWWRSEDAHVRAANQRQYHGLKAMALRITNSKIREALTAAHPEALAMARRFPPKARYAIYCAAARSPRLLQLCATFPLLARMIVESPELRCDALAMVEAGRRLRDVADYMRVPMVLRRVTPGATTAAVRLLRECEGVEARSLLLHSCLPIGTSAQKRWQLALGVASRIGGPYVDWVARHAIDLGVTVEAVLAQVQDLGDFARASYAADCVAKMPSYVYEAITHRPARERRYWDARERPNLHGVRSFSPDMSVATMRELSGQWHEAVALANPRSTAPLPRPWRGADRIGDLKIVPLTTAAEIAAEGRAMHHCVATFTGRVRIGEIYIYGARDIDGTRVATIEVALAGAEGSVGVFVTQMRGPCNSILPKSMQELIRRWVRQKDKWKLPTRSDEYREPDDIPF